MSASIVRVFLPLLMLVATQQFGSAAVIHAKAWLAPQLIARAWTESQTINGDPIKPWPWADTWPVARLRVASQQVDQFVLAGDSGNALAFSPGHSRASAQLGSQGRAVISGHRDTHFAFLQNLVPGERFTLELAGGVVRRYRVIKTSVVDSSTETLANSHRVNELLLVTCYPFDAIDSGGPLRYVVAAKPEPLEHLPRQSLSPAIGEYAL